MISKSLFFKMMKEDMKLRVWTIAIFSILLFLLFPVVTALRLQNYYEVNSDQERLWVLKYQLGPQNEFMMILIVLCAIVCGLSSFFYIYSKKKVDLYHSLPVKREIIFAANYVNGLLVFLVPYIINVLLTIGEGMLNRLFTQETFIITLKGIMVHSLYYWMIYTVTIIAVMLTGNIWTSFLGAMVFMSYGYIISMVKASYYGTYFRTYFSTDEDSLMMLSPVQCYYKTLISYKSDNPNVRIMITHLIITLVLMVIALFLFKKRPSEAAGKAMAFEKSKTIIKFLLVIPLSLLGGMLLRKSVSRNYDAWLIFGIILSLVILYGIVQVIFNSDIRSAFQYKKHLLICALITFAIVGYFRLDPFRYDEYIPKENSIKSIGIYFDFNPDQYDQYIDINYSDKDKNYISPIDYHLQRPIRTNLSSIYSLCKSAIQSEAENPYFMGGSYMIVKYNLKSGRAVYRSYHYDLQDKTLIKELYDNKEFKEVHYPIFTEEYSEIEKITISPGYKIDMGEGITAKLTLTNDKKEKFLDIYKEEFRNLTYDQYANVMPLANFISIEKRGGNNYFVYPTFTKTIAYLKECGLEIK